MKKKLILNFIIAAHMIHQFKIRINISTVPDRPTENCKFLISFLCIQSCLQADKIMTTTYI